MSSPCLGLYCIFLELILRQILCGTRLRDHCWCTIIDIARLLDQNWRYNWYLMHRRLCHNCWSSRCWTFCYLWVRIEQVVIVVLAVLLLLVWAVRVWAIMAAAGTPWRILWERLRKQVWLCLFVFMFIGDNRLQVAKLSIIVSNLWTTLPKPAPSGTREWGFHAQDWLYYVLTCVWFLRGDIQHLLDLARILTYLRMWIGWYLSSEENINNPRDWNSLQANIHVLGFKSSWIQYVVFLVTFCFTFCFTFCLRLTSFPSQNSNFTIWTLLV